MPSALSGPLAVGAVRYSDPYVQVSLVDAWNMVRIVRTAVVHPDTEALRRSYEGVIAALDVVGRKGRVMLFDSRAPVGRNDPAFEQVMSALRPRIDAGFLKVGVLVASASGALQIRRWVTEDGIERVVTSDDAALATFLIGDRARGTKG